MTRHDTRSGGRQARPLDGPFTKSKERAGLSPLLECRLELCSRHGTLMLKGVDALEMDLRQVVEDG